MSDTDNTAQRDQDHAEFIADDGHCSKCRYDSAFDLLDAIFSNALAGDDDDRP